jgi:hypothetical protein
MANSTFDNGSRRLGIERRQFTYTCFIPERRSGEDRRSGFDRREKPRESSNWDIGNQSG